MPTVPTYERNVSARPLMQQGVTTRASAEAFGASTGRGLQALGQGGAQLAQAVGEVEAIKDEALVREKRNAYMKERDTLMYDPQSGYLNTQGRNAIDGRDAFTQQMSKLREKYADGLTPQQASLFGKAVEPLEMDATRTAMIHDAGQTKEYVVQQGAASASAFGDEAIRNIGNKAMADKYMTAGIMELRNNAKLQGLPPEQAALQEQKYISSTTAAMVKQLALSNPLAADAFMKENQNRLTVDDKYALENGLQDSVYAAKGQANALAAIRGAPIPSYSPRAPEGANAVERRALPDIGATKGKGQMAFTGDPVAEVLGNGPTKPTASSTFQDVVGKVYGLNENTDGAAIASFIKRSCGISVDPQSTPWCAAFVNAVLGAQGIEGTGKLNARSFLNFGTATDSPKPGDIVVLSRGSDTSKGHVGFFQGYDPDGNVMILGGNQGDSVKVSKFAANRVLGFRTGGGSVTPQTADLPNFSPQGLLHIQDQLAGITDPREYAATQKALDTYLTQQKKTMDAQRDQVVDSVSQQLLANPTMDVMKLPLDVQQALGKSGMSSIMEFQDKVRAHGEPTTDPSVLFETQQMDPQSLAGMSQADLIQYRPKLNNADFKALGDRVGAAKRDIGKAISDGSLYKQAHAVAQQYFPVVGITSGDSSTAKSPANLAKVTQFNQRMELEVDQYRAKTGKSPGYPEMQLMAAALVSVQDVTKGGWFTEGSETPAFMRDAATPAELDPAKLKVVYSSIPMDWRSSIVQAIKERKAATVPVYARSQALAEQPTPEEISAEWLRIVNEEILGD